MKVIQCELSDSGSEVRGRDNLHLAVPGLRVIK